MEINNKGIYKKPQLYIWGTIVFLLFAFVFFVWQLWDSLSIFLPINHAIWGQFGDFVGGTLGVIFSLIGVIFVVITFNSQQRVANEQRFNTMFFETLRIFHEQEKELQFEQKIKEDNGVILRKTYNYKDFFDGTREAILKDFHPKTSFSHNRKLAVQTYAKISIPVGGKLSLCYKTIYRLLDMIDNSSISETVRQDYAKLLRAQFTENELLCMRYHVKFGDYRKFAYLINKYNMLKHLPIFDMLEFTYWYRNENLDEIEKREIGTFFIILSKNIKKRQSFVIKRCNNQLSFDVYIQNSFIKIKCLKRPLLKEPNDNLAGIYKYSDEDLVNLLICVLKELVIFSNFSCYNNFKELEFGSDIQNIANDGTFEVYVKNRKGNPIFLSFNEASCDWNKIPKLY